MRLRINYYFFRILVVVSLLVVGFIARPGSSVYAINYGEPDGDEHPYVGVVAVYDTSGQFFTYGSGVLISPTVVLTAGHVAFAAQQGLVRVSFESDLSQFVIPPDYDPNWGDFPNTYDIGVVVLNEPVYMDTYGELPDIGALDTLATKRGLQNRIFTVVGYGYQSIKPFVQVEVVRYKATSMLVNLRSALTDGYNLQTSNNPGKGQGTGGSCFGDSGGPVFFDDTNVIAAVVSFGLNKNCKGADFGYRVDIPDSQDFILGFLC